MISLTSSLGFTELSLNERELKGAVSKNIVLLSLGLLVSLFGASIFRFATSLYILSETGSGLSFSLTLVMGTLPGVLFGPISGVIADRVNRKYMVVIMDIISGLIVLGLLVLSIVDDLKLIYIYVTTFLLSTASVFFNTPMTASLPNMVDDENLTRVNSLTSMISSVASIAGPFLGGIIYAIIEFRVFLLITGVSFILSGVSEIFIDFELNNRYFKKDEEEDIQESVKVETNILGDIKEGLSYMVSQKWLMSIGVFVIFLNLFIMMGLYVPVPYIVREVWGFSAEQYGLLNTMFPVGMLLGSLILAILPQAKKVYKILISSLFAYSVLIIVIGVITSEKLFILTNNQYLSILIVLYVLIAISAMFADIPFNVVMQKLIPDDKRGRITGTLRTLTLAFTPVGAIIGGILVDSISPWILPIACGLMMCVLLLTLIKSGSIKDI